MKVKIKCENCKVEILFTSKDVRKLTSKEKKLVKKNNKHWQDKLDEVIETKTGIFKKKIEKSFVYNNYPNFGYYPRREFENNIIKPIGIVKCPICSFENSIKEA